MAAAAAQRPANAAPRPALSGGYARIKVPAAPGAPAHQPYAPYNVFVVAGDISHIETRAPVCTEQLDPSLWAASKSCCRSAYFLGGAKSGSTTLSLLLKHSPKDNYATHDPDGPFVDAGKEPCWAKKVPKGPDSYYSHFPRCLTHCNKNATPPLTALDACPLYTDEFEANRIACIHPDTRFVMLVRDPVKRITSRYNAQRSRRHLKTPIDVYMRQTAKNENNQEHLLSAFDRTLEAFLTFFQPHQILVVHSEALRSDAAQLQIVLNIVCDHLGVARRVAAPMQSNSNSRHADTYVRPDAALAKEMEAIFAPHDERFFSMLGSRIEWPR